MTNTVFVGNLPITATEDQLRELFAQVGEVVSVRLLPPRKDKLPYGFVEMGTDAEAAAAIERLDKRELDGCPMIVEATRQDEPKPPLPNTIFVGNLSTTITEDQLRELFAQVGEVVSVKLLPPRKNKPPYGFVEMGTDAEAAAAIERLDKHELDGRPIAVKRNLARQSTPNRELALDFAQKLNEASPVAVKQIRLVITLGGEDFARALLEETLAIEAAGGMLTRDQSRRRTAGGAFLYLARSRIGPRFRRKIFTARQIEPQSDKPPSVSNPPAVVLPPLVWDERLVVIQPLLAQTGKASNVKITIIGRPGQIEERQNLVITVLEYEAKGPTLPKGVPTPPQVPTLYTVYIASKQWQKVVEALADPEDKLIIEGLPVLDPDISGISVFATNVTTKNQQAAARKPAPKAETPVSTENDGAAQPQPAAPQPKAKKAAPAPEPAPRPSVPAAEPPPEAIRKLGALRQQEDELRDRLTEIKAQPPEEQIGLGKTLQELKQAQAEIKALKQQYPRLS